MEEENLKMQSKTNGNSGNETTGDIAALHIQEKSPANPENVSDSVITEHLPESFDNSEVETPSAPAAKKRRLPIYIVGSILIIAAACGTIYWLNARNFESTDDAFIEADVVQISPKVAAYVAKVHVRENQRVRKGDLLIELDPKDYQTRLKQAVAQLHSAQAKRLQSEASVNLTRKTVQASQLQAGSNVQTAKSNVEQTRLAANSKQSQIQQAQTAVKTAKANLAQTRSQFPQAESNLELAQIEFNRRQVLFKNGDVSRQSFDVAANALQTARSQLDAARKQVDAAASRVTEAQAGVTTAQENYRQSIAQIDLTESQVNESSGRFQDAQAAPERIAASVSEVGTAEASIEQAQTMVQQAEIELSYTKIYAPEDGYVTRKAVLEGQLVQPGSALMALSQSDELWVVANFKETQLELMRVGQAVEIEVDAYPGETFHGKIESFQTGTGSRFSILPAENATGNYVKVVQRVPVKIVFDEKPDKVHLLTAGMSVEPSVRVR